MDDKPFDLATFLPIAAADLIPQLLAELSSRIELLQFELSQPGLMGRPRKKIDPYMFLYLLLRGHSINNIATYLNVSRQTLYRHFGDIIAHCDLIREDKVLTKQDEKVDEGDVRMLIHIGKTRMGQTETVNVNNVDGDKPKRLKPVRPPMPEVLQDPTEEDDSE